MQGKLHFVGGQCRLVSLKALGGWTFAVRGVAAVLLAIGLCLAGEGRAECPGEGCFVVPEGITQLANPYALDADRIFKENIDATCIHLPSTIVDEDGYAEMECYWIENIEVTADHPTLRAIDGVLFSKDEKTLLVYPAFRMQRFYAPPEGTEEVGAEAFSAAFYLEEVVLPDSVQSIGKFAFHFASELRSIHIPDSVTDIGGGAFCECRALTQVKLPASLREISDRLFLFTGLEGALIIPEGVTGIGVEALCFLMGVTDIYLPSTLEMQHPEKHGEGLDYVWELNIGWNHETPEDYYTVLHAPPDTFAAEVALASPYPVMLEAPFAPGEEPTTTRAALGERYELALRTAGLPGYHLLAHATGPDTALAVAQKGLERSVCAFAQEEGEWQLLWRNTHGWAAGIDARTKLEYLPMTGEWLLSTFEGELLQRVYTFDAGLEFSWFYQAELKLPESTEKEKFWNIVPEPGQPLRDFSAEAFLRDHAAELRTTEE